MKMAGDLEPIPAELTDGPDWATEELDEALLAGAVLPEVAERWTITDDGAAEWAMRRLAAFAARAAEVRARAAGWRTPIDEWERAELERVERPARFFAGHLERYGLAVREANPRQATIPLPSGEIATRAPKAPTVSVSDDEALVAWLGEHLPGALYGDVVKVTYSPQVLPLRKLVVAVAVETPWCVTCGAALESVVDDDPHWVHALPDNPEFDVDAEYDHEPQGAPGWSVRWQGPGPDAAVPLDLDPAATAALLELVGAEVPGLSATLGDATVKVKPR